MLYFLVALVLTSLEGALIRWVGGGLFSVSLALPVVLWLGLRGAHVEGAVSAAAIGYVLDLQAGQPKGLMTFLAVALFLLGRLAGAAVDVPGRIGFAILTFVGTFLVGVTALGLLDLVAPAVSAPGWGLLGRIAWESGVTALAAPFVAMVMERIDRLFAREDPTLLR